MSGGGRIGSAVAVFQDKLYIIGGYSFDAPHHPILSDVLCFDLLTERSNKINVLPFSLTAHWL